MSRAAEEVVVVVDDNEPLVAIRMKKKLDETDWGNWRTESPTIFRVFQELREVDEKAYEPQMISFGPYHRNKPQFAAVEKLKWLYLKKFLSRNLEVNLKDYAKEVKRLEQRTRSSYSENIEMESDDFVEMMLLDGCFIVELLLAEYGNVDDSSSGDGSGSGKEGSNSGGGSSGCNGDEYYGGGDRDSGDEGSDGGGCDGDEDNGVGGDGSDSGSCDGDKDNGGSGGDEDDDDYDINEQIAAVQEFEDPILNSGWALSTISKNMIMLENQLPFFLLERLLSLNTQNAELHSLAVQLLTDYFWDLILPNYEQSENDCYLNAINEIACKSKPYHLLHLFYILVTTWHNVSESQMSNGSSESEGTALQITESMGITNSSNGTKGNSVENSKYRSFSKYRSCLPSEFLCRKIRKLMAPSGSKGKVCETISIIVGKVSSIFVIIFKTLPCCSGTRKVSRLDNRILSATKLQDAGVNFMRKEEPKSLLDISFKGNILEIPELTIHDNTNCLLRNLIAFEQCCQGIGKAMSHYACFMDSLIDTTEDVEILQQKEIFHNRIGNQENIASLWNQMGKGIFRNVDESYLFEIVKEVNKFCNKRRNRWRAKLNQDYFGNPWAIISLLAAVFLLILTAVQTGFAPLSYFRPPA